MSHVEEVEVECDDLDVLQAAVERCGGEFMFNQRTYAWWGNWLNDWRNAERSAALQGRDPTTFGKCEHAIRVAGKPGKNGHSGPWEIGVIAKGDGKFALDYDNYGSAGRALEQMFGVSCGRLKDEVAAEITERELVRDGWRVSRADVDGAIVFDATR